VSPVPAPKTYDFTICATPARRRMLFGFACKLTRNRDDAADLVQDTLLHAYQKWDRWVPGDDVERSLSGWLNTMMRNLHINQCRYKRLRQAEPDARAPAVDLGLDWKERYHEIPVAPTTEAPTLSAEIRAALDDLHPRWRRIAELVWLHDGHYHEVAAALQIPIGTVMSSLNRVRNRLIARLGPGAAAAYGIRRSGAEASP
jgi:RNA polymerase sigma-70 factor (ECF subfamily)